MATSNAPSLPPFAILYARVSTKEQRTGHSLEGQTSQLASFCASAGVPVGGQFVEVGSGIKAPTSRPQLSEALQAAQGGALVVWRLDRLSRSFGDVVALLEGGGPAIVCSAHGWHTPQLTLHLMASVAQAEVEGIRSRVRMGLETAKAKGIALGCTTHKDPSAIERARALAGEVQRSKGVEWLKGVAPLLRGLEGRGTLSEIAQMLKAAGVQLPRGGTAWNASRVSKTYGALRDHGML